MLFYIIFRIIPHSPCRSLSRSTLNDLMCVCVCVRLGYIEKAVAFIIPLINLLSSSFFVLSNCLFRSFIKKQHIRQRKVYDTSSNDDDGGGGDSVLTIHIRAYDAVWQPSKAHKVNDSKRLEKKRQLCNNHNN